MPHYKDGTPARVGDRVRGRGYNIKAEVEGYVLKIDPSQKTCNLTVGLVSYRPDEKCHACGKPLEGVPVGWFDFNAIESGQADAFERSELVEPA